MNIELWERWQRQADEADIKSGNSLDEFSFQQMKLSSEAWVIESPIEHRLYVWLKKLGTKYGYLIQAQWELDRFRYDFAITDRSGNLLALIECDGREFHSTPEQLARDAEKNAAAEAAGIRLFRWTGREIYRDAHSCAEAMFFWIWPRGQ